MGFNSSWIGVRGVEASDLLERLGLEDAGEAFWAEAGTSWVEARPGWVTVIVDELDWAAPDRIAKLSEGGGYAVGCSASETVMWCKAWGCRDGSVEWSVEHDPKSEEGLQVEGHPPPEFGRIRERLVREQQADADVDLLFDAPIELTAALCGFNPSYEDPENPLTFRALIPARPRRGEASKARPERRGLMGRLGKLMFGDG